MERISFRIKGVPQERDHSFRFQVNALYHNNEWSTFDVELDTRLPQADDELRDQAMRTFEQRRKHPWPPNIVLRGGWDAQLRELIARSGLDLSVDDILCGVQELVARIVGVEMPKGYRYHFVVLDALNSVPNITQYPLQRNDAYEAFVRMTETEGWWLAHMLPYPAREGSRAMLAILEQPIDARDQQPEMEPPRLELSLHTGTVHQNEYTLLGEISNVAPEAALGVTINVTGIEGVMTIGTLARDDGPRAVSINLEGQRARTEALDGVSANVRFSDRHGRTWVQSMALKSHADASKRFSYEGTGLGQPQPAK